MIGQVTVLLSTEHALNRGYMRAWLGRFDHLRVVAETGDPGQLLDLARQRKPSLVLVDYDTIEEDRATMLSQLRTALPAVKVILSLADTQSHVVAKVLEAGIDGFVLKDASSEDMETAIETVCRGGCYMSPGFFSSLASAVAEDPVGVDEAKRLSPRQMEILRLVATGLTTKAIGYELKISPKTVDVHKRVLMKRLGVQCTTELVKYAVRSGLVAA